MPNSQKPLGPMCPMSSSGKLASSYADVRRSTTRSNPSFGNHACDPVSARKSWMSWNSESMITAPPCWSIRGVAQ